MLQGQSFFLLSLARGSELRKTQNRVIFVSKIERMKMKIDNK